MRIGTRFTTRWGTTRTATSDSWAEDSGRGRESAQKKLRDHERLDLVGRTHHILLRSLLRSLLRILLLGVVFEEALELQTKEHRITTLFCAMAVVNIFVRNGVHRRLGLETLYGGIARKC